MVLGKLNFDNPLILLSAVAVTLIAGLVVHYLLFGILKRFARRSEDLTILAGKLCGPSRLLILFVSLYFLLPFLQLEQLTIVQSRHFISLIIIFSVAWLSINATIAVHQVLRQHYDIGVRDNLRARKVHTQLRVLERIIITFIVLIALSTILMTFEKIRQLGLSLLASAGIAGVVLGFAAQQTLSMILAGIQIAFTQPIRIDDVVIVEGEWGRIEEITLTYVVVVIWDERRLVVPISYFITKPFQNWTRNTSDLIGSVFVHVDYTASVDGLREELTRILESTDLWDQKVNVLQVTDAKESSMELRALVSAVDSQSLWDLRVLVREKLIYYIHKNAEDDLPVTRVKLSQTNGTVLKKDGASD